MFGIGLTYPFLRDFAPPVSLPEPMPARPAPVTPKGLAHAFGIMLARDYPDVAYDLADAVARGVQIGLKGDQQ